MKVAKTLPAMDAFPWKLNLLVRFSDTDAVGHLNNVSVFRYHDNAAMAFITDALGKWARFAPGQRLAVLRQDISLETETFYPDPVTLCAVVTDIQREWFVLTLAIFQKGQCTGISSAVVALLDTHEQALELPPTLVSRLRNFDASQH